MNARTQVLVVVDGSTAGRALAMLAIAELGVEITKPGTMMDENIFGDDFPREKSLGFMEFFDWLATTGDQELYALDMDLSGAHEHAALMRAGAKSDPLTSAERHKIGLRVWQAM